MSLNVAEGSFAANLATGNQSVTGLGFQPKIIFFWVTNRVADGGGIAPQTGFGVAVSSSDRRASGTFSPSGSNSQYAGHDNTKCFLLPNAGAATDLAADFVSMDADGFTVNLTVASGSSAFKIFYLALGGTDITNVKTGQILTPAATGNQGTTGIGFQPDCLMFMNWRNTGTAPPNVGNSNPRERIGAGVSSSSRFTSSGSLGNSGSATIAKSYQRTDKIIGTSDAAVNTQADLVSLDADGFTLNWDTVISGRYEFWVAMKGARFALGSFNQPAATGAQAITGVGFQPTLLMLVSDNFPTSTSVQSVKRFTMGVGYNSSHRHSLFSGSKDDGAANNSAANDIDSTKIMKMMTADTPTTEAAADLTSLDANGFTLNWSIADATAREILYLAIGATGAAAPIVRTLPLLGAGL